MNKQAIIRRLAMAKHIEGGYFSETYRSTYVINTDRKNEQRSLLTSIYYLLTDDRPIGYFHKNQSDIIHYFHAGHPLTYLIIEPDGVLHQATLGSNILLGEHPQLLVRGGCWKATLLEHGEYGLLGEAVAPGFDYSDMELATKEKMQTLFPQLWDKISAFVKP